jgi:hypothetical protein
MTKGRDKGDNAARPMSSILKNVAKEEENENEDEEDKKDRALSA